MPSMGDIPEKVGRPERFPTKEETSRIVNALLEGNYREVACQMGPVPYRTFNQWLAKGKKSTDPKCPYSQFLQAVLDAERMAEMEMVELVRKAAKIDAKHAQWYLERKFPERWAANRIELRELKRRVEELEKAKADAGNSATAPQQTEPPSPEANPDAIVEHKPDELHPDE